MGSFYDLVPLSGFQSCTNQVTYLQSGCNIMEGSLVADILHYSRFRVPMFVETVFCISISHALACMLVCARHSLLPCNRLHRYFSCTRLHVGFAHVAVYCHAPVCIGIFYAPDCMLVLLPFAGFIAPVRKYKKYI